MKHIFITTFLIFCWVFLPINANTQNSAIANKDAKVMKKVQSPLEKKIDTIIFSGMKVLYDGHYDQALTSFQKVIDLAPENPSGYFFYAVTLESIMKDHWNYDYQDEFYEKIGKSIEFAEKAIKEDDNNAMAYLYKGASYGYRGIYSASHGSFFRAFIDGGKGYKALKKSIERDPNIYDAYFGIGIYEFYKVYYLEKFLWLKGDEFTKEDAFKKVKISATKAKYCRQEAEFSLLTMYLSDGKYQELIQQAKKMQPRFPKKITLYVFLSIGYKALGDHENALKSIETMQKLLKKSPYSKDISYISNDFDKIQFNFHLADEMSPFKDSQSENAAYFRHLEKTLSLYEDYFKHLDTIETKNRSEEKYLKMFEKMAKSSIKEIEKILKVKAKADKKKNKNKKKS